MPNPIAADSQNHSATSPKARPGADLAKKLLALPVGKLLVLNLFLLTFIFQVFLITRFAFLYYVLKGLFVCLILLLALAVVHLVRGQKLILLCLLFILVIRIPYYIHPDSLLFMSDNALEALQPLEIRDAKAAPFFLLDSSSHNGTLKYLCIAFLWDFLGVSYLAFLLFQLIIYMGFIYLIYDWLRRIFDEKIILLLVFAHFSFIEVLFDYSLFLRGGPYLEMLFFFVLGIRLFDFTFRDPRRLFLAAYFFMMALYIHSLSVFLVVPFLLTAFLYSVKGRSLLRWAGLLLAGVAAGQFHFVYYKFFYPPPPPGGTWYTIHFFPIADFAMRQIPVYVAHLGRDFWITFQNLLSFEFSYHHKNWNSFEFYFRSPAVKTFLFLVNRALVFLAFLIFIVTLVLVMVKLIRRRFFGTALKDWIYPFFLFLFLVFLGKLFILSPAPHYEPRHNMDLAFLLLMSCVLVAVEFLKIRRVFSWKSLVVVGLCLLFTAPHYFTFLRVAAFKHDSYRLLMPILRSNRVKYLNTDFSLAYIFYFLSNRQIRVTDSIGPNTVEVFYPGMRKEISALPPDRQAYLFVAGSYPWDYLHFKTFHERRLDLINTLRARGDQFRVVHLKYYILIIPEQSRIHGSLGKKAPLP